MAGLYGDNANKGQLKKLGLERVKKLSRGEHKELEGLRSSAKSKALEKVRGGKKKPTYEIGMSIHKDRMSSMTGPERIKYLKKSLNK